MLRFAPNKVPWERLSLDNIPFLSKQDSKPAAAQQTAATSAEYLQWRDSLDRVDLLIRTEQDPHLLSLYKVRQLYFWKQLEATRSMLQPIVAESSAEASATTEATTSVQTVSSDPQAQGLIKFLSKVLTITAVVLLILILVLFALLKRKRNQLTKQLEALQEDTRFQGSRAGVLDSEPTRVPMRKATQAYRSSPNAIPDTAALDLAALAQRITANARQTQAQPAQAQVPPTPERAPKRRVPGATADGSESHNSHESHSSPLRPTARQRVTTALKGLAEALSTLKSEEPRVSAEAIKNSKPRVRSQNTKATQDIPAIPPKDAPKVMQPSRYDREREENAEIVKLSRRGFTSSEIARRLRVPQDQVETVIRMHREAGE